MTKIEMTKQKKPPFAVGDKVTTDFHPRDRAIVRAVTKVVKRSGAWQSGWLVSVDAGTACAQCERTAREWLTDLDSGWFTLRREHHE